MFDLILPVLQPPLGDALDNPVAFAEGQELRPFQNEGVKFLVQRNEALLADEMGLGKSIQAIVALRILFRQARVTSGLVLCPKSVLTDWERKFWEWAPELKVAKVRGTRDQRAVVWRSDAHVYLTNYETLATDLARTVGKKGGAGDIARTEFNFAIFDEIQKVKNPTSDNSKAARSVQSSIRWGLSGTPLENRLEDLVAVFDCLKPGLLRVEDARRPEVVKNIIKRHLLRRRKEDVLPDLPEKNFEEVWLDLLPAQRERYDRAEKQGVVELNERGDSVTVQHVLALIGKLKQICNMDPVTKESCKLEFLKEKLEEISGNHDKAIVCSQYPNKTLQPIASKLRDFAPLIFDGSLSESERARLVDAFQNQDDNHVMLMSVATGALGLTLTKANYVFHYDLWWNPATAQQAEDRVHRIGQEKQVFVYYLYTEDTIERRIYDILDKKKDLFAAVIDDLSDKRMEALLTEEELFGLFGIQRRRTKSAAATGSTTLPKDLLSDLSPSEFEHLVAELFRNMGYDVKETPQTRDQGVDVYAKRTTVTGTELLAIQCKHYPGRVVGVEHVRALYGVVTAQQDITRGVLVTSGDFSSDCREFRKGKRLELYNGAYLRGLLAEAKLVIRSNETESTGSHHEGSERVPAALGGAAQDRTNRNGSAPDTEGLVGGNRQEER